MLSAVSTTPTSPFVTAPPGSLSAWTIGPTVGPIFLYQTVFKRVGLHLPFTTFERELLTEINTAPAQLHHNSWAFARAFEIMCGYLGILPSVDVFLHFFEVKKQGKSLWVSFSGVAGRILLTLFQNSYEGWKGQFFRVC